MRRTIRVYLHRSADHLFLRPHDAEPDCFRATVLGRATAGGVLVEVGCGVWLGGTGVPVGGCGVLVRVGGAVRVGAGVSMGAGVLVGSAWGAETVAGARAVATARRSQGAAKRSDA